MIEKYEGDPKEILFPHDEIRPQQDYLIGEFNRCLEEGENLIVHGPTGIGKTSAIGPALNYALKNKMTVFFLTSRHTQHQLAIDTLRLIKEKYSVPFVVTDIIGKRWMCNFEGNQGLNSGDYDAICFFEAVS